MTKQSTEKPKPKLVTRVSLIDTFRALAPGESATFDCMVGSYVTARSCVTRLNQAAGYKQYSATTDDNGATYTITRSR